MTVDAELFFRVAVEDDLPFVVALEHKNKESLGFLPKMAIAERIKKQTLALGMLNGEPFGYLLYDSTGRNVNILQACIQYDARRRMYGAAMYAWALALWAPDFVRLKCAADLESNLFWREMGLTCVAVLEGGKRRGRKINVWHRHEFHGGADPCEAVKELASAYRKLEKAKELLREWRNPKGLAYTLPLPKWYAMVDAVLRPNSQP